MTERETEIRDMNTGKRFRTAVRRVATCSVIAATCSIPFSGNVHAQSAQVGQSRDADQAGQGLPGGASSLQETYGDWRVACAQQNGKKTCALSQRQTDKDSRQLVLAVELSAPAADKAEGTLILPFGLAIERPITLQIDQAAAGQALHFRTCLPVGCLVGLNFEPRRSRFFERERR